MNLLQHLKSPIVDCRNLLKIIMHCTECYYETSPIRCGLKDKTSYYRAREYSFYKSKEK